jgi:hypothetical protein
VLDEEDADGDEPGQLEELLGEIARVRGGHWVSRLQRGDTLALIL